MITLAKGKNIGRRERIYNENTEKKLQMQLGGKKKESNFQQWHMFPTITKTWHQKEAIRKGNGCVCERDYQTSIQLALFTVLKRGEHRPDSLTQLL